MQYRQGVIIGCGIMGRDIAAIFLAGEWTVQVVEANEAKWAEAAQLIAAAVQQLGGAFERDRLVFRTGLSDVVWSDVDVVLEAISENLEAKRKLFESLDHMVPPHVPIGSNSSSMRISDLAQHCETAFRMANTHFFQPAHLVPLVEIAKGERTDVATIDALHAIFRELGRAPVRVNKDVPGFLANRIQHALMREAFSVIDSGLASAGDVDIAVQFGFGFRYAAAGPILLKEFAGFDTQHAAATVIYPSLCNDTVPSRTLAGLVARGHLGMKAKQGMRSWTDAEIAEERARYETALMRAAQVLGPVPSAEEG
ncbi:MULTISPECIES: 3-hydroxyacyl-CoA dehydrogenase NAD-binding domain-containing protein [Pandoraea]|uniref:3-hydroxyacyl-CoA dehydrogenase NAD-binding domain-containing protein n=1 Tax=Pandoraea TaxID=93217 RepID=UPI001F5D8D90|nr:MULTISPECIES: 3-hydroxyacyl-CoA dehydrogenase NAD-binding domain-containing protein [Pandoraea]MCI3206788.1 3-hydroxyacyl-CoA dehydrogenase [Pandoraea sp. LA3]MDN4584816.1 3-hydroxyacyl-CoA dehydrogenase [Pandoraea capi]